MEVHLEEGDVLASTSVTTSPQLQTLNLGRCRDVPLCLLTKALAALPRLTDLTLPAEGPTGTDDVSTALAALNGQLTRLAWIAMTTMLDGKKLPPFLKTPAAQHKLAQLQQLDLYAVDLDDTGLHAMMAHLPALTHVTCRDLKLQYSHADAQMARSWEELLIMMRPSITAFAHLPLRCIKRVRASYLRCLDVHDSNNPAAASTQPTPPAALLAAALAAAPNCRFCCHDTTGALRFFCPVSQLPTMLPLLARWEGVKSMFLAPAGTASERLTPAAVGVLGALLEGMSGCTKLILRGLTPRLMARLLPAVMHTPVQILDLDVESITEAHLMQWCTCDQGSRSFVVVLSPWCNVDGKIDRVRAAIAESGSAVQLLEQPYT